ncbi:MAG TPA: hypothetical protein VNV14_05945 [Opitutaceae bacterium]|jgi:hypothetical protein|nr:hypothetical protein [Opitutaceae bacterium]
MKLLRAAFLFISLLIAGCRDSKVDAYRVPKEKDANFPVAAAAPTPDPAPVPASSDGGMNVAPVAAATGDAGLTWTAPASWQAKPLGVMRKGSYTIVGAAGVTADVSITAFPGAVGGEFANVNRWRSQLSLPPIVESDLDASVTHLSQDGLTFTLVDLTSTDAANPRRILGAMVPYDGAMWFFKLSGPDAFVATTKRTFLDFLATVKPATP